MPKMIKKQEQKFGRTKIEKEDQSVRLGLTTTEILNASAVDDFA